MKHKLLLYPIFPFVFFLLNFSFLAASTAPDAATSLGVKLDIRVFLKGALLGVNVNTAFLMRDDLRSAGYLPINEPYSAFPRYQHIGLDGGNEAITDNTILSIKGTNAIVDWVFIELRNPTNPVQVLATRSALLQRDGDVVDVDGVSSLGFDNVAAGEYYVAVRHRNHLGIMTANAFHLTNIPVALDFSDPSFATYGAEAQQKFSDKMVMIGGDYDQNGKIVYMGPNNDILRLFSVVLSATGNTNYAANYIYYGYSNCDYNMDGKAIFLGPNNDRATLLYQSLGECLISQHPNCIVEQQLPK